MSINGFKVSPRLSSVGEYYFSKKLREIATLQFEDRGIINLGIGSPDMPPPEGVIDCLSDAARENGSHMYQSYKGIPKLREAFAFWYKKYFRVKLDPDKQVLPLIGSKEGIMHISMAFIHEGDEVLVPDPGYPTYKSATQLAGGTPVDYKLSKDNDWLPDLEYLSKKDLRNVRIMWINYPHMPTGARASSHDFWELIAFAREHQIILVNDNPYAFILNNNPLSLLENAAPDDPVLELNSLSKSHNMAGWRVGVVVGNHTLLQHVLRFKSNMDSGMFLPVMLASVKALDEKDEWYENLNKNYAERREYAWQLLDKFGCKYDKDQSGLFVWAEIPENNTSGEEFADWLLENMGIFVAPGFIFGNQGNKYIRISLCNDLNVWEEVLSQVKKQNKKAILSK